MKCELCHQAEAETTVTDKSGEIEKDLYVCRACAENFGKPTKEAKKPRKNAPEVTVIDGSSEPPEFVKNFLTAAANFMQDVAEAGDKKRVCPKCGQSWDEIDREGRVRCPACYQVFAKMIAKRFMRSQFGSSHKGPVPESAIGSNTLVYLKHELAKAVKNEDYRAAAAIQKKIDAIRKDRGEAK